MATAHETKRIDALQLIFSFFLGLLLVVLIGAGVWTFYPEPFSQESPEQKQLDELYREQGDLNIKEPARQTPAERARSRQLDEQIQALNDRMQKRRNVWTINTSIILLSFATVLMAVSLFLPDSFRVLANGVLLGGLFTVIYGTGWSFTGGTSRARFFVILAAVLLAVVFGYLRFIRGRRAEALAAAGAVAGGAGGAVAGADAASVAALAARVEALETRAAAAAEALRGEDR